MALFITKFVHFVFSPITHWFLLILWILVRSRNKGNCGAQILLLISYMFLVMVSPVPQYLLKNLEQKYPVVGDTLFRPEAVVVLGGGVVYFDPESHQFHMSHGIERLLEGMRIHKSYPNTPIYLSGWNRSSENARFYEEGPSMKALAIDFGVPADALIVENRSKNTHQNALETVKLLRAAEVTKFYLVTSASHMNRAMLSFKKQGLDPVAYPVDFNVRVSSTNWLLYLGGENLILWERALHEYIGTLYYSIRGFI